MQRQAENTLVPVQLLETSDSAPATKSSSKERTLALTLHTNQTKLAIYNGVDKYILYAVLKELTL